MVDGILEVEQCRVHAAAVDMADAPTMYLRSPELVAEATVTEAALNKALAASPIAGVQGMQVQALDGKLRVQGRAGRVPMPFVLVTVPQVVESRRIRLEPDTLTVTLVSLPGPAVRFVVERINQRLAEVLDTHALPLGFDLTHVEIQVGRLVVRGRTSLEIRPTPPAAIDG